MTDRSVEEITKELRAALVRDAKIQNEKAKRVKANYVFTLLPNYSPHIQLMDPSCYLYDLRGIVTNRGELASVGKKPLEGSMTYIYNSSSGLFVTSISGGTRFFEDRDCWTELSLYITPNPRGGDVTDIVNKYRKF